MDSTLAYHVAIVTRVTRVNTATATNDVLPSSNEEDALVIFNAHNQAPCKIGNIMEPRRQIAAKDVFC